MTIEVNVAQTDRQTAFSWQYLLWLYGALHAAAR